MKSGVKELENVKLNEGDFFESEKAENLQNYSNAKS